MRAFEPAITSSSSSLDSTSNSTSFNNHSIKTSLSADASETSSLSTTGNSCYSHFIPNQQRKIETVFHHWMLMEESQNLVLSELEKIRSDEEGEDYSTLLATDFQLQTDGLKELISKVFITGLYILVGSADCFFVDGCWVGDAPSHKQLLSYSVAKYVLTPLPFIAGCCIYHSGKLLCYFCQRRSFRPFSRSNEHRSVFITLVFSSLFIYIIVIVIFSTF